jgi:hypothetical protein
MDPQFCMAHHYVLQHAGVGGGGVPPPQLMAAAVSRADACFPGDESDRACKRKVCLVCL